jgi:hypothetical protein
MAPPIRFLKTPDHGAPFCTGGAENRPVPQAGRCGAGCSAGAHVSKSFRERPRKNRKSPYIYPKLTIFSEMKGESPFCRRFHFQCSIFNSQLRTPSEIQTMTAIIPSRKDNLVIENIRPLIEGGKFAIRREPGDTLTVQADIFRHSHEKYEAAIEYRHVSKKKWERAPMHFVDNDLWEGTFQVKSIGFYEYKVVAWTVSPSDVPTESPVFELRVDPYYARRGTWYEMWPRSQGKDPKKSGDLGRLHRPSR